jgi:hypothetical protein
MLLASLLKLSNLMRGLGKKEKPQQENWLGAYLNEDDVVTDVLKRVSSDPVAVQRWLDPWSWQFPPIGARPIPFAPKLDIPDHAGCLLFAPMSIRNYYGMWHANNPYTEAEDFELTDGYITDPRHPDNFSRRVVDRVKAELAASFPQKAAA